MTPPFETPHRPTPNSSQTLSWYPAVPAPVRLRLVDTGEHACPYLPPRLSSNRAFWAEEMPPAVYQAFMDAGFRRSGKVIYQPVCRGCRRCVPIRIPAATFAPTKSQRRTVRKNQDLRVLHSAPNPTAEKYELYRRYTAEWHGKRAATAKDAGDAATAGDAGDDDGYAGFVRFLYDSPVVTVEHCYRDPAGRLLGVGICDLCPTSLSSVYFYHDPSFARRGLGTFSLLYEIEECRSRGLANYYLGYWIAGCRTMEYKANFGPHELLGTDGVWRQQAGGGDAS